MTYNQIQYAKLQEDRRSNVARETETNRSNLAQERETNRHNLVYEGETRRSNLAREGETHRSNLGNEGIAYSNYLESVRSAKAREAENRRSNVARERETTRSNLANEAIRQGTLAESTRHNTATENQARLELGESQRHNKATERTQRQQASAAATNAYTNKAKLDWERDPNNPNNQLAQQRALTEEHNTTSAKWEAQKAKENASMAHVLNLASLEQMGANAEASRAQVERNRAESQLANARRSREELWWLENLEKGAVSGSNGGEFFKMLPMLLG